MLQYERNEGVKAISKLIVLVILLLLGAFAPSPFHKIQPTVNADRMPTPKSVSITPVVTSPALPPVKPFDINDRSTWPTCPPNQVVWAQDGLCHEKPVSKPPVAQTSKPANIPTDKTAIMIAAGVKSSDFAAVDYIVSKESGWRHLVRNNEGSGAYGLCQALPATKMASAGSDYLTNPVTQMKWCNSYATSRYGGWWAAHSFWTRNHWW